MSKTETTPPRNHEKIESRTELSNGTPVKWLLKPEDTQIYSIDEIANEGNIIFDQPNFIAQTFDRKIDPNESLQVELIARSNQGLIFHLTTEPSDEILRNEAILYVGNPEDSNSLHNTMAEFTNLQTIHRSFQDIPDTLAQKFQVVEPYAYVDYTRPNGDFNAAFTMERIINHDGLYFLPVTTDENAPTGTQGLAVPIIIGHKLQSERQQLAINFTDNLRESLENKLFDAYKNPHKHYGLTRNATIRKVANWARNIARTDEHYALLQNHQEDYVRLMALIHLTTGGFFPTNMDLNNGDVLIDLDESQVVKSLVLTSTQSFLEKISYFQWKKYIAGHQTTANLEDKSYVTKPFGILTETQIGKIYQEVKAQLGV